MDTTLLSSGEWTPFVSSLPRVGLLAGLGMLVALALVSLRPASSPPAGCPVAGGDGRPEPGPATPRPMDGDPPAPVAVAAGATTAPLGGVALVPSATLSPTDLIALAALRRRVRAGEVADGPTGTERLAFTRWLVEHGRLAG